MARIAINGFGRIGRLFFRQAFEIPGVDVVAINDLGDVENLGYLLKYDTVYRRYDKEVKADSQNSKLIVDGKEIAFLQIKDPAQLPWKDLGIDIVVESTGLFDGYDKSKVHLQAGAKRVVITAPAKDDDGPDGQTVLMGVNEDKMKSCSITSNGSCTTNSASPVIQILSDNPGIIKATLSTVHAYTATQSIVDGPIRGGHDFRRAARLPRTQFRRRLERRYPWLGPYQSLRINSTEYRFACRISLAPYPISLFLQSERRASKRSTRY